MLLRFGCENYKSISEYQEILLTASSKKETDDWLLDSGVVAEKVLPIAAIYGGNGSGKTNMIKALRYMLRMVFSSNEKPNSKISNPWFKLDPSSKDKRSLFDMDFICGGVHYHYGFTILKGYIDTEWLYSFSYGSRKSRSVLFYRDAKDEEPFYFGKHLKGKNRSIESVTGTSTLFLSSSHVFGHEMLSYIYNYLSKNYRFRFSLDIMEGSVGEKIYKDSLEDEISRFLSNIDVGASRISVSEVDMDDDVIQIRNGIVETLVNVFDDKDSEKIAKLGDKNSEYKVNVHRKLGDGEEVKFAFTEESLGTRAIISLLVSTFEVLKNGGVFVVDELESSLHTLLSLKVVELFNSPKVNKKSAQLIFTTHETQLLNFDNVRRDEVWFAEKCSDGSSRLYPLSDYKVDKRANLRNGYLDGRFGAIPFLDNLDIFDLESQG